MDRCKSRQITAGMGGINNTIDKFGRSKHRDRKAVVIRGPAGVGFKLTSDKHYDIQGKRLQNVGEPIEDMDGVTRNYVEDRVAKCVHDTLKATQESANLIMTNVRSYSDAKEIQIKEQNHEIMDKRLKELMEQMQAYTDKQVGELSYDTRRYVQEITDLIVSRLRNYTDTKNKILSKENHEILDKLIKEVMEQMRVYISRQIEEVKSLNVVNIKQNNALVEKVNKLEQTIAALQSIKEPSGGRLAHPVDYFGSGVDMK